MTLVSHLTLVVAIFFALMGTLAAVVIRTASAPLYAKIIIPALMGMLACSIVYVLPEICGYPLDTTFEALPQRVEIIAFLPYADDKMVALWLRDGDAVPRAYTVPLTDGLKKSLRAAQQEQETNGRAMLVKGGKKRPGGVIDIDGGNAPYELDVSAFALPRKETGQ